MSAKRRPFGAVFLDWTAVESKKTASTVITKDCPAGQEVIKMKDAPKFIIFIIFFAIILLAKFGA